MLNLLNLNVNMNLKTHLKKELATELLQFLWKNKVDYLNVANILDGIDVSAWYLEFITLVCVFINKRKTSFIKTQTMTNSHLFVCC